MALKLYKAFPVANFVAVIPPSLEVLRERIEGRGRDSQEEREQQYLIAEQEIQMMLERKDVFLYRIINEDFYVSQQTLMRLVETLYSEELIGVPLDIG